MISFFQEPGATRNAKRPVSKIEENPTHFTGKCFVPKMTSQMTFTEKSSIDEEATQGLWMVNGRPWTASVDCDFCSPNTRLGSWLDTMIHKVPPRSNPM